MINLSTGPVLQIEKIMTVRAFNICNKGDR